MRVLKAKLRLGADERALKKIISLLIELGEVRKVICTLYEVIRLQGGFDDEVKFETVSVIECGVKNENVVKLVTKSFDYFY